MKELSNGALERLREAFEWNFSGEAEEQSTQEIGAALSLWQDGKEILSLCGGVMKKGGEAWSEDTLVPVYSATKGPAVAVLLMCLEEAGMDGESLVECLWPEFPVPGVTFAEIVSHQCGLAALDKEVNVENYHGVIQAIEEQKPAWSPEDGIHGYHPRTVGFIVDECVRRLTGERLGQVWLKKVAEPLGIDFYIGLPEKDESRVATLYPGKLQKPDRQAQDGEAEFYKELNRSGSFVRRAFSSPKGLTGVQEMNDPKAWHLGLPAMGGIGSARSLAKFYQAVLGKVKGSPFSPEMLKTFSTMRLNGYDQVLRRETAFSTGMMMDPVDEEGRKKRQLFGDSARAFGHAGAGGSHAFADPEQGLSFAYVMNQMELTVLPGKRVQRLIQALK